METEAIEACKGRLCDLRSLIADLVCRNGDETTLVHTRDSSAIKVGSHISSFIKFILLNPAIQHASAMDKATLKYELLVYLQAHVPEVVDDHSPAKPFPTWIRTSSADSTSAPFAFAFIACLLSATLTPGKFCSTSAAQSYMAAQVCRHMASMCRIYNDAGSVIRDAEEGTLNSIDFPEFSAHKSLDEKLKALHKLGEFERECMMRALASLEKDSLLVAEQSGAPEAKRIEKRKLEIWRMFCDQVDLYGQVYILKDLSSKITETIAAGRESHKFRVEREGNEPHSDAAMMEETARLLPRRSVEGIGS